MAGLVQFSSSEPISWGVQAEEPEMTESTGESSHRSSHAGVKSIPGRGCAFPSQLDIKCHWFRVNNSLTSFQHESNFRFLCFECPDEHQRSLNTQTVCEAFVLIYTVSHPKIMSILVIAILKEKSLHTLVWDFFQLFFSIFFLHQPWLHGFSTKCWMHKDN